MGAASRPLPPRTKLCTQSPFGTERADRLSLGSRNGCNKSRNGTLTVCLMYLHEGPCTVGF